MSKTFPIVRIATDMPSGVHGLFDAENPTIIQLNRQLFDRIEQGQAAGGDVAHIIYQAYVTLFHELGHWFGCTVGNILSQILFVCLLECASATLLQSFDQREHPAN